MWNVRALQFILSRGLLKIVWEVPNTDLWRIIDLTFSDTSAFTIISTESYILIEECWINIVYLYVLKWKNSKYEIATNSLDVKASSQEGKKAKKNQTAQTLFYMSYKLWSFIHDIPYSDIVGAFQKESMTNYLELF